MDENGEQSETQNSGFIQEVLIVEQHKDECSESGSNREEEEEEEIFSDLESSRGLADNISDSFMYDNLEIAINNQRRIARPQQNNNFRNQQVNSTCCLLN